MSAFAFLAQPGIIGNYQSAKLTLLTLHDKKTRHNTLAFARVYCQREALTEPEPQTKLHTLNKNFGFGITQYDITMSTAEKIYTQLSTGGSWPDPKGHILVLDRPLKLIVQKYTGPGAINRENDFLAKTVSGSYWTELFNERKRSVQVIYDPYREGLLEKMAPIVKQECQIDLEKARDRIGNIIFQFPVTHVDCNVETTDLGKAVNLHFHWHLPTDQIPDIHIHVISLVENSVVDFCTLPWNGEPMQKIKILNYDTGLFIRIVRTNPEMVLYEWRCPFSSIVGVHVTLTDEEPTIRSFNAGNRRESITLHFPNHAFNPLNHLVHSQMAIARVQSKESYRQFEAGQSTAAMAYLQELVRQSRAREIMIIDPYLSSRDILNVLYFSTLYGRLLRAIGSVTAAIPSTLAPGERLLQETEEQSKSRALEQIKQERSILSDPRNSNKGLTLEFRMQHGQHGIPMHDRFLLFQGVPDENIAPIAYSIGTSFNSVGKSYHIIGVLEGSQKIIDDFERQWSMLNASDCLVFKCVAPIHKFS